MVKYLITIFLIILVLSCNSKQSSEQVKKIIDKENQIINLHIELEKLQYQNDKLKNQLKKIEQSSDYYRFIESNGSEINVSEKLKSGKRKLIDKKDFKDTLDISDNFFVYKHTSKIHQTSESEFETVLRDFNQVKSEYGIDFFVRVMTFYNGENLPLETENSKTDIHILIQPTELGFNNKTFIISDFFDVDIKSLEKIENSVELVFEHGRYPRKKELVIINPELVKFGKKNLKSDSDNITFRSITDLKKYNGFEKVSAQVLGNSDKALVYIQKDSLKVLILEKIIKNSSPKPNYSILDEVNLIFKNSDQYISLTQCELTENTDKKMVFSLVENEDVEFFDKILKTWIIDLDKNEFREIESDKVKCLNEWFGYSG